MRPKSIVLFDRLFLASLGIAVLNAILGFDEAVAKLNADPATAQLGSGGGFVITIFVFSIAIPLLLWFFIAKRASNVAKWVLVIVTVIGLLMIAANPSKMLELANLGSLLVALLQLAAIACLFRSDARAWLSPSKVDHAEMKERGVRFK